MRMATTFDIFPAIDLRGGLVVRLQQGDFERETTYGVEPAAVSEGFARMGARWLHVVDLDGARSGKTAHGAEIAMIIATVGDRVRVEVAGGLRDEVSVAAAFAWGASRVVVGTAALWDPALAGRLVTRHGADRIVAAIDVREGRAVGHGWLPGAAGIDASDAINRLADLGFTTFEVTAIERDGLVHGPDNALYERLVRLDRGSIIASGGVATLGDVEAVRDLGASGAIIGRAIYEGRIDLRDALALVETAS